MKFIDITRSAVGITAVISLGDDLMNLPSALADEIGVEESSIAEANVVDFQFIDGKLHLKLSIEGMAW
jgi:hypothetical protein